MGLMQQFKKDKQKLHDNLAHCLFCIYNQQDITHYFAEMMQITELMKMHYQQSTSVCQEINMMKACGSQGTSYKTWTTQQQQNGVTA